MEVSSFLHGIVQLDLTLEKKFDLQKTHLQLDNSTYVCVTRSRIIKLKWTQP